MQCTADPCWIFTLFRLMRMLSIELYTCIHPSSVPSHMVGSPSKSTGSVGYMPSGTRSWLASLSSSSSLDELHAFPKYKHKLSIRRRCNDHGDSIYTRPFLPLPPSAVYRKRTHTDGLGISPDRLIQESKVVRARAYTTTVVCL